MIRITRALALRFLVALTLSAVAASGAQASEGPFYKIQELGRLTTGSERVAVTALSPQLFEVATAKVKCAAVKASTLSQIEGSSGKNGSKGKGTLEYSSCIVEGNGATCTVENGSFTTKPLILLLGYASKNTKPEGTGKLLTLIKPEMGREFAEIKFTPGTGCIVASTKIETKAGCTPACEGIIGEGLNGAEETLEVGVHETEALKGALRLPPAAEEFTTIFTEANGAFTERKGGVEIFGVKGTYKGFLEVTLVSGKKWGVFS